MTCSATWRDLQTIKKRNARLELCEERNYDILCDEEDDAVHQRGRASEKVKKKYLECVTFYEDFLIARKEKPEGFQFQEGYPAPTLPELKRVIRFKIASTKGKLDKEKGYPTMDSILNFAQKLIPGYYIKTGLENKLTFQWIDHTLVADGALKNIHKPKFNYKLQDFERTMIGLWAGDDPFFMQGRYRVQFHFTTLLFLCTGARVGAFAPGLKDKASRGLRYQDIELVLFRTDDAPWKMGYRVDQRWVKNNRDPENIQFGTAIWDCDEPLYAGALYLLAMALSDNALFGFSSSEEIFEQRIPEGQDELVLRWKEEARSRCVIRNVTATEVTEDALTQDKYEKDFRILMNAVGYYITATIHAIRRALGAAVQRKYSPVHTAQILTQKSKSVFGRDYLPRCADVDTISALRGEKPNRQAIEHFQGFTQFYEHGLPRRLPAAEEKKIASDPQLADIATRIEIATDEHEKRRWRNEYRAIKRKLFSKGLQNFQHEWVKGQRDWKILTRGRERHEHKEQTTQKQVLCKIMPELGRIAAIISFNKPLAFDEKATVVQDLYTHCQRDFDVVYRPGEEPIEGKCPVNACNQSMKTLKRKTQRSQHIHSCCRQENSDTMHIPLRQVSYCWECFSFHDGNSTAFEEHCASHISSMSIEHYEVIVYRHTTIRCGYCIVCMWDGTKSARHRMQPFERSTELRDELNKHISQMTWPSSCSDPACKHTSQDEQGYRDHLHDLKRKRLYHDLGESPESQENQGIQPNYQIKPRKRLSPSPASPEELKINFWTPNPTKHLKAVHRSSTKTGCSDHGHEDIDAPSSVCESKYMSSQSGSPSVPSLGDLSTVPPASLRTSISPPPLPIDPRILEMAPTKTVDMNNNPGSLYGKLQLEQMRILDDQQQPVDAASQSSHEDNAPRGDDYNTMSHTAVQAPSLSQKMYEGVFYSKSTMLMGSSNKSESPHCLKNHAGEPTRPLTRAQAKKQAAQVPEPHLSSHRISRKTNKYPEAKDKLLQSPRKKKLGQKEVTRKCQQSFPGRSKLSVQRQCSILQPLSPRLTRSRSNMNRHVF
ncbi:hypothetical protein BDV12DRAFT_208701 [Aspergillus spectabilis]